MHNYEENWGCCTQIQLWLPLLAYSNQKTRWWSDQSKSPSNQLHKYETKKWKGFRVSKIGNVEVAKFIILAFVRYHSSNIDIFVCIA